MRGSGAKQDPEPEKIPAVFHHEYFFHKNFLFKRNFSLDG